MEQERKSRWEGHEFWFRYDHKEGLRRFEEIASLGNTPTAIALRSLKFQLEENLGFEISDALFIDIFKKVCNFRPAPALGGYAGLEFIQPIQRIFENHNIFGDSNHFVSAVWKTFRIKTDAYRTFKNILLHIPHASTQFPESSGHTFSELDGDEGLLIDYYTDELFSPEQETEHILSVVFPYCRLYCDVERLINDPLDTDGLGFHYDRFLWNSPQQVFPIRSFTTKEEAFKHYVEHHSSMSKRLLGLGKGTLLIDCHSFSSQPNLLCSNPPDIDICIGFNDDATCPNKVVIGNIKQHFNSCGYKVAINTPFSNSKTFEVPVEYHSVMIEVNKCLYINEQTLEKTDGFDQLKADIQSLYEKLLYYGNSSASNPPDAL